MLPFPDINPVLISFEIIGRTLAIHWYAISYIAGFLCALSWMRFEVSRVGLWQNNTAPLTKKAIEDVITWMIIGTILGGRLGYVLFYQFDAFLSDPLRIVRVWEGGMSFHGALIGVYVGLIFLSIKNKIKFFKLSSSEPFPIIIRKTFLFLTNLIASSIVRKSFCLVNLPTDMDWRA